MANARDTNDALLDGAVEASKEHALENGSANGHLPPSADDVPEFGGAEEEEPAAQDTTDQGTAGTAQGESVPVTRGLYFVRIPRPNVDEGAIKKLTQSLVEAGDKIKAYNQKMQVKRVSCRAPGRRVSRRTLGDPAWVSILRLRVRAPCRAPSPDPAARLAASLSCRPGGLCGTPGHQSRALLLTALDPLPPPQRELNELRKQVQEARSLKDGSGPEFEEKNKHLRQLRDLRNSYNKQVAEIRVNLKGLDCKSEEELDGKIRDMEHTIAHVGASLTEEKKMVVMISKLNQQREKVRQATPRQATAGQACVLLSHTTRAAFCCRLPLPASNGLRSPQRRVARASGALILARPHPPPVMPCRACWARLASPPPTALGALPPPQVREYDSHKGRLAELETESKKVQAVIQELEGEFNVLKGERDQAYGIMTEIRTKLSVVEKAMKEMDEEVQGLVKARTAVQEKLQAARSEMDAELTGYKDNRKLGLQVGRRGCGSADRPGLRLGCGCGWGCGCGCGWGQVPIGDPVCRD
jgi:hypothetical protein